MKVVQVNVCIGSGSTGRIVKDIHDGLSQRGVESRVYYGRGRGLADPFTLKLAPEGVMKLQSLWSRITGFAYAGCHVSTANLLRALSKNRPEVVHLHCINGCTVNIYELLSYLKRFDIATVITLHAEFMYTAGCGYALDCDKWITGCHHCPSIGLHRPASWFHDRSREEWLMMRSAITSMPILRIVAVSPWVYSRAARSPFFSNREIAVIPNGIDTTHTFRPTNVQEIMRLHRIKDEKIILHITPNFDSPIKGGRYVIEVAWRLNERFGDKVKLIIVGINRPMHGLPNNVILVQRTSSASELAAYYSLADVTLLTSQRETFSMVCVESLSCGTPVVGFLAGGPESIALAEHSCFVSHGDVNALTEAVISMLVRRDLREDIASEASQRYAREAMVEAYLDIYKGTLK